MTTAVLDLVVPPLMASVVYGMLLFALDDLVCHWHEAVTAKRLRMIIEIFGIVFRSIIAVGRITLAYIVVRQRVRSIGGR